MDGDSAHYRMDGVIPLRVGQPVQSPPDLGHNLLDPSRLYLIDGLNTEPSLQGCPLFDERRPLLLDPGKLGAEFVLRGVSLSEGRQSPLAFLGESLECLVEVSEAHLQFIPLTETRLSGPPGFFQNESGGPQRAGNLIPHPRFERIGVDGMVTTPRPDSPDLAPRLLTRVVLPAAIGDPALIRCPHTPQKTIPRRSQKCR